MKGSSSLEEWMGKVEGILEEVRERLNHLETKVKPCRQPDGAIVARNSPPETGYAFPIPLDNRYNVWRPYPYVGYHHLYYPLSLTLM